MTTITLEQFLSQTTINDQANTKKYEDKILIKGPIFSLQNKNSAVKYTQAYTHEVCLLVETPYYLQVWHEIIEATTGGRKASKSRAKSSSLDSKPQALENKVTPEFITVAKKILSEYIGPIASIVCKKTLSKNPDLTIQQFIDAVAKKIPSSEDSIELQHTLLEFVKHNY